MIRIIYDGQENMFWSALLCVQTPKDNPFVAISVHTGNIEGKIWLNDRDHEIAFKYTDITGVNRCNVEDYFDKVAIDYDKAMRNWGYCLPQILSNTILEKAKVDPKAGPKVRTPLNTNSYFVWNWTSSNLSIKDLDVGPECWNNMHYLFELK